MAQHLSMEDLVKKYKYLTTNQRTGNTSPRTDGNQKTHETERNVDEEFSRYSKSSSMSPNKTTVSTFESSSSPSTSENTCKVCMDAEINCAFIECGHTVTCLNCAKLLTKCPVCRETIKRTLRIYKS